MTLLAMADIVQKMENNKEDKSLYIEYATKLNIKSIDFTNNDNVISIQCSPIYRNISVIGEHWVEMTFVLNYDVTSPDAIEVIQQFGYSDYKDKLSIVEFFRIKSIGWKLYKYLTWDHLSIQVIKRELNINNYDDVSMVRSIYLKRVSDYRWLSSAILLNEIKLMDTCEFSRDEDRLSHYTSICDNLLDVK